MDFDAVIDRSGTGAVKWEILKNQPGKPDVIPLWVADMDFPPPEEVIAALHSRIERKIFGYTLAPREYAETLSAWYLKRHGASIDAESILPGPGVIPSLCIAAQTLADKGEGILVMPPVYFPFFSVIRDNDRTVVEAPLRRRGEGAYEMDLDAAEKAVREAKARGIPTRAVFFCSPHNPGGRVWSREELEALLGFAAAHDLAVVSDEIHGDIICSPRRFVSLAEFAEHAERVAVFSAPNKTFNLAGLQLSHVIARGGRIRETMRRSAAAAGFGTPNLLSMTAALAAYRHGGSWLDDLLEYLRGNMRFAVTFINERIPGSRAEFPEGTYLIWTDVSGLMSRAGIADSGVLARRLEEEGRVKLSPGAIFGAGGQGFVRINAACPRKMLAEGLERFRVWAAAQTLRDSRVPPF